MKRSVRELANVLIRIHRTSFCDDECQQYRLQWSELRALAGVDKLKREFITEVNDVLQDKNYALVSFNTYLVVLEEDDFEFARKLSGRVLEKYLPDEDDSNLDDDDEPIEDDEV